MDEHVGGEIGYAPAGYIVDYINKNGHKKKTYHFFNKINNLSEKECCELIILLNKKFSNYVFTKQQKEHTTIVATCIE